MSDKELIQECIEIIGEPSEDDWKILPTEHAKHYEEKAPLLSAVLCEAQVEERAKEYERADRTANEEQAGFKKLVKRASWCIFTVLLLGAGLMVIGALAPSTEFKEGSATTGLSNSGMPISILFGVLAIVIGALATYFLTKSRNAEFLTRWYRKRAKAEKLRLDYFENIVAPGGNGSNRKLNLLKLEYLRRYLLDSQKLYYDKRGTEHLRGFRRNGSQSAFAAAFATAATGLAGILAATVAPGWTALAALGIVATGFIAQRKSNEDIEQHQRNATQYEKSRELLADLSINQLAKVRQMLAAGTNQNAEALTAFCDAIRTVLMEEHAYWLEGEEDRARVIDELSKELERLQSEPDQKSLQDESESN